MRARFIVVSLLILMTINSGFSNRLKHLSNPPKTAEFASYSITTENEKDTKAILDVSQAESVPRESQIVWSLIEIFKQGIEDGNLVISDEAAQALSTLRDPQSIDLLISALGHPDVDARIIAAWALGEIGNKRAVLPLENVLKFETKKYVRLTVETALRKLRSEGGLN